MAEIFDLNKFRNKKSEDKAKKEDKDIPTEGVEVADLDPFLTECRKLFIILRKIYPTDSGRGHVNRIIHLTEKCEPHTLRKMREIVKEYSTEELIRWLTERPETEWMGKPAFFHALAHEVQDRILYAASKVKR